MITLNDYLTASGRYPERVNSQELTEELYDNARNLLERVNNCLADLGWEKSVTVSSGFRPSNVNAAVGGAKRSAHMQCKAIDMVDDANQTLGKLALKSPEVLRKHGLFMENLLHTPSWVHFDCVNRKDRPSRTFIP